MREIASKRASTSEKVTAWIFFALFIIIALICVYPLFWALNNSLKTFDEYDENKFILTQSWQFFNYVRVFTGEFQYDNVSYLGMLWNSLWIVVVKVFVNVASSTMLAYAVARFRFPGKDLLYVIVILHLNH